METLIVLLPLAGAIIAGLISLSGGRAARAAELITSTLLLISALLSWLVFWDVAIGHNPHTIKLFTWIASGSFVADWAIRLDTLSAVMLVVVNTVSCLVHFYSIGYMQDDRDRARFFSYLSLFTFAMLSLVTADNLIQLFFGWEGVGLASYLLIGFWYEKPSANAAAIKAFVVNRVGDFGFALGIMAIFYVFRSIDLATIFEAIRNNADVMPYGFATSAPIMDLKISFIGIEAPALEVIGVLLFIGAMGKSAQFLLHTWLPDAMEGPTPVSALIHAATMVTAGVYLVCLCSPLYAHAPGASALITLVGATTAFFAASVGLLQDDIKKVIAYSTCSQLGYMFFAAGVGAYGGAMFHLFTHAFFKALLFLGAGAVIHGMHHEQDMKKMGGVRHLLPATHLMMLAGTIAITGVGLPGFHIGEAPLGAAGFVSKDFMIEQAFERGAEGVPFGMYAFVMGVVAAAFTSFYSWRVIFLTFWGPSRAPEEVRKHPHPVPNVMMWPLVVLATGALFAGMAFYGDFIGSKAHDFWGTSIYQAEVVQHAGASVDAGAAVGHDVAGPAQEAAAAHEGGEGHHLPWWIVWSPTIAMLAGLGAAYHQYMATQDPLRPGVLRPGGMIYGFLRNKWYFDEIYDALIVKPAFFIGRLLWKGGDGAVIDGVGPDGVASSIAASAKRIIRIQTGYMYHYAFAMLIGVAIFITVAVFRAGAGQ